MEVASGNRALKIAVYAALTYDIISATNSSPQTTEINASVRAETLMKWVKLGLLQAAGFAVLGALLDDEHWPPILGAGIAGILLWVQYKHAEQAGLENPGPPSEVFGGYGNGEQVQGEGQAVEPNIMPEEIYSQLPSMA